ncbi:hypothetical protein NFI96_007631 [Prochilodus magdalenae]|nr:hypothetical protein NFI96_007631 [Prochilodus magdalenae]
MLWAGFSSKGPGNFVRVHGIMNALKYQDILIQNLVASARKLKMGLHWVFQQDNDPKHMAKSTQKWFTTHRIKLLPWPSQSPDLNPIENLWVNQYLVFKDSRRIQGDFIVIRITCEGGEDRAPEPSSPQPPEEVEPLVCLPDQAGSVVAPGGSEVHKEHTDIRVLLLQVGEGSVDHRGNGIICGSVPPVGVLVWVHSDVDGGFDVGHNQSFKAFSDYRRERYRPVVIQTCHCGALGDRDDGGGLQAGDSLRLSELRIVLLGYRFAGKSSAGNTILNREEFELKRTAQCVKRQGDVAGRHITVVEAPGWWSIVPVEESTELLKQEIVLSVSLCPPGPHAVLLIVRVDRVFKETYRRVFEGYLNLLTDTVWSHTIVLFTFGDCLGDTPIEQHIESEGKELQWLVEKCGNRYHVLNNKNRSDDTQVTELLEKIEEMVAANSGRHFEMDRKILKEVEEKRRAEEERVKERMMKVQKQREYIRSLMSDSLRLSELRIVLLGYIYSGKSSAGNTILNREEFKLKRNAQCVKRQGEVAERHITVVEAPGWWRDTPVEESTELLKQEIVFSLSLCPPGPHAVLLIICVDWPFKRNYRSVLEGYLKLLTDTVWSHTIVLFTCGDWLGDTPIEQHIESEGKELQWLVEKCGNRYHVLNNKNRSDDTQVTELLEKIEEVVAANGRHFEVDRKILQKVEEKRRAKEERVNERMMVQKQREHIRSLMTPKVEKKNEPVEQAQGRGQKQD